MARQHASAATDLGPITQYDVAALVMVLSLMGRLPGSLIVMTGFLIWRVRCGFRSN